MTGVGAAADKDAATPITMIRDRFSLLSFALVPIHDDGASSGKLLACHRSLWCFHVGVNAKFFVAHIVAHPGYVCDLSLAHVDFFTNHRLLFQPHFLLRQRNANLLGTANVGRRAQGCLPETLTRSNTNSSRVTGTSIV